MLSNIQYKNKKTNLSSTGRGSGSGWAGGAVGSAGQVLGAGADFGLDTITTINFFSSILYSLIGESSVRIFPEN